MRAVAASLNAASSAGDWPRVAELVTALTPELAAFAAAGPLTPAERRTLEQLRAAHDQAEAACARAARELKARLDDMHSNKDGWMAYALDSDAAPAGNRP